MIVPRTMPSFAPVRPARPSASAAGPTGSPTSVPRGRAFLHPRHIVLRVHGYADESSLAPSGPSLIINAYTGPWNSRSCTKHRLECSLRNACGSGIGYHRNRHCCAHFTMVCDRSIGLQKPCRSGERLTFHPMVDEHDRVFHVSTGFPRKEPLAIMRQGPGTHFDPASRGISFPAFPKSTALFRNTRMNPSNQSVDQVFSPPWLDIGSRWVRTARDAPRPSGRAASHPAADRPHASGGEGRVRTRRARSNGELTRPGSCRRHHHPRTRGLTAQEEPVVSANGLVPKGPLAHITVDRQTTILGVTRTWRAQFTAPSSSVK